MKALLTKSLVAGAITLSTVTTALAADITGAGATFPYPIYAKWAEAYKAKTKNGLNYQSIGSSGGIKQIKAKTVDFGASDAPVKFEDLEKDGLVQFPAIIGGVVPVINVEGIKPGQIKVTGDVLAQIFMGTISKWSDAKIAALNPGVKLPDANITVVHRADGSGTTAIFTDYLAKVNADWKKTVGAGAAVKWPAASSIGGKGNEGVAANVNRVKNSIGYVEYAYTKKNNMPYLNLVNQAGQTVKPDDETFAAAAAGTDWSKVPGMGTFITNAPGAKSWPITGASFILMYKEPGNKANAAEVLKFFDFAFKEGKKMAADLDYVPMPDATTDFIRKNVWTKINTK
ncbi:phosphate ABC transporter substrate-binding protein PstS [Polynucleobacter sp. MWH-CaK5]|jgi:phosphate transport system substrate-binding protein|uniref:phosphate ABC transporter substrate-binding protein PstS n=1 Tax=Polynucleobacter sp. MWH-CaK5 TaxID=2689107 RepID=UPI002040016E|nr:phosphate ABC transporter substrate-binding protein PstS [Polynucleobacter sp. MWH-CaK5]QWD88470.1 phosphate ABC transporter substrate-binding protein PstS [Polynucleobacter sp. MWH-CaK5]